MKLRKIQIFAGSNKELAIHIFFVENQENCITSDKLNVIFPGLPQTPTFTQLEGLVNDHRAVAYVHYYGSWYSGGEFNPLTVEASIKDAVLALEQGIVKDVYSEQEIKISVNKISLVGNSLGGYFVYKFKTNHNKILLSPLLPTLNNTSNEVLEKINQSILSYQKSLLYCYRGITDSSWNEFTEKIVNEDSEKDENMSIYIYIGTKDKLITKEYVLSSLSSISNLKEIDCGHDFLSLYNAYITDTEGK